MGDKASLIGMGLYTLPEAALLLGRHVNTVRSWVQKGLAPAPVHLAFGETTILSFHDLVSLMVVRRLTDEGVHLSRVRKAERYLRIEWRRPRPFATEHVLTGGNDVFVALEKSGHTAASRWGQESLPGLLRDALRDVRYAAMSELAEAWSPHADVMLRPDIQFGQPCIAGTRLTTRTVAELVAAGDAIDFVAEAYSIDIRKVEAALEFEEGLIAKAA
ncbi:MAG: DUF433 domain-containing protein [Chloroflexota bacterium]|nr:DUF433 domain-containing protein [Chloroflexota bacterium]